jgi:hypothetical protein
MITKWWRRRKLERTTPTEWLSEELRCEKRNREARELGEAIEARIQAREPEVGWKRAMVEACEDALGDVEWFDPECEAISKARPPAAA